ncbi:MAG: FAD:protein FMN transferase, partial [Prevotella sp.]|nr:FAD:protein FMN transferase [Prevotella sp.]
MNYKRLFWQVPFLLILIIGTVLIIRQQQDLPYQHNRGTIFGTTYSITYQSDRDLHAEILAELQHVDASLSMFNPSSTISRINRNERVEPDKMFIEVITLAQKVSEQTDGAFDITVAPLVNAWG